VENNSVMTTIALKKYLISKINLLEDDDVLSEIKEIVDKNEIVYQLSDYHLNRIEESRAQFKNGEFYTQEEVNLQVEKWLNKK
jgi:hypothetical protein